MAQTLGSLPVGTLVKDVNTKYDDNVIIWRIIGQNHDGENTTTLRSEYTLTEKYFDEPEPANNDYNRQTCGDDRYSHSNILSWLNSDRSDNSWYVQRHLEDVPPDYYNEAGFLNGFGTGFKEALIVVNKKVAQCAASTTYTNNSNYFETVSSRIFLHSLSELGIDTLPISEDIKYDYYTNNSSRLIYKTDKSTLSTYMLRSPRIEETGKIYYIKTNGSTDKCFVNKLVGIAPCCVLNSSIFVSNYADELDGVFILNLTNNITSENNNSSNGSDTESGGYLDYAGLGYFASKFGGILPRNPSNTNNLNMWMEV